ncbi:MAG: AraC family transcriptional regulator [Ruminococcaceae bacterium]|nr:AraC family transcriptional regulator [Oscillospiraceae bacterium]
MLAEGFLLHYKKDEIASGVLWENHCHAQFELIAVLTGDVCITLEGEEIRLADGEAILIPPLCYHIITARKKCTYRRLTATFDEGALPHALRIPLGESRFHPFRTDVRQTDRLRALCKEDSPFYAPLAGALMIQLLYASFTDARQVDTGVADPVLHKALLYIEEHLCEKLSLDDIAASIPASKSFLCHRFQERMKVSPKQYILQKRMAIAAKLIREGISPTEAAARVGYDNYSNFYRIYKKHRGDIPSKNKR